MKTGRLFPPHPADYPPELERLVGTGVESGAALSGTVQTANIGIEKIVCNIVTNLDCQHQNESVIRQAVWSCYQETLTEFRSNLLSDPDSYSETPMSGKITWKVTQPFQNQRLIRSVKRNRKLLN